MIIDVMGNGDETSFGMVDFVLPGFRIARVVRHRPLPPDVFVFFFRERRLTPWR